MATKAFRAENVFLGAKTRPSSEPVKGLDGVGIFPREPTWAPVGIGDGNRAAAAVWCVSVGALVGVGVMVRRRPRQGGNANALTKTGVLVRSDVTSKHFSFVGASRAGVVWQHSGGGTAGFRARSAVQRRAMFERFTEKSMKAIMMAQAESRKLAHDHVGSEMLVVGIIAEGSDLGAQAMIQLGVGLQEARIALETLVGHGSGGKAIEVPFTAGARQTLEYAIEFAREQGSASVGTAHLLQAVLRREDGLGAKLLQQLLACDTAQAAFDRLLPVLSAKPSDSRPSGTEQRQGAATQGVPDQDGLELTETLKYAQDLTLAARDGKLDPMFGREKEFDRTVRILGRRSKNNPVLVGEAGVGKTSIAHGLAQRIVEGRVPQNLRDKRVLQLDLAMLLAGTRYRGDFEERLRAVVGEVAACGRRVILVIDEVHTIVGAGSGGGGDGGGIDAANLLKPALARGELQCIGATTLDEYRAHIEKDPALERRFQPVHVPEPTQEETVQILTNLAPRYEQHHRLKYTSEAIKAAVKLATQYISDRYLPDKAIDVMDEAGSKVRQELYKSFECDETFQMPPAAATTIMQKLQSAHAELEKVRQDKKLAVAEERYDEAQRLKAREVVLEKQVENLEEESRSLKGPRPLLEELQAIPEQVREHVAAERFGEAYDLKVRESKIIEQLKRIGQGTDAQSVAALLNQRVTEKDVAQVVASWTGIAVEEVSADESARLLRLEEVLHESIVGQEEAVKSVSQALRRARAGLRNPERPIAGFMFSGPTGVGKTELCKTLASSFFGSGDSMIRLDMSEFMEKHTVSKLIGAPPGYVGYSEGGALTEAVRRRPYSLVLFDEVEKAHPDVFNLMLQLLDDGRLTDSKGRTVSFANTLIVMTTNLGSRSVEKSAAGAGGMGFGTFDDMEEANYGTMKDLVHEEMKSFFRPEFLNRLDEVVVFRPLTKSDVRSIAEFEFQKVLKRLKEQNFDIVLTASFKDRVVDEGFDPAYGARPLRRAIMRLLEDQLAEHLLANGMKTGGDNKDQAAENTDGRKVLVVDVDGSGRVVLRPDKSEFAMSTST